MVKIPLEEWIELSVQDRLERLEDLNRKPTLFQMFIMVILKKMEGQKSPPLLDRTVFKRRRRIF